MSGSQGTEVDDPECADSDPEADGSPRHEHLSQKVPDREDTEEDESDEEEQENVTVDEEDWQTCSEGEEEEQEGEGGTSSESFHNSSRLLQKEELLNVFKAVHNGPRCKEEQLTVGLVSKIKNQCKI